LPPKPSKHVHTAVHESSPSRQSSRLRTHVPLPLHSISGTVVADETSMLLPGHRFMYRVHSCVLHASAS
jgi:hypothetical protein